MEIRTLKYFVTIAQEENMTRAAAILHISQPSLSRAIAQLEDELGVKLFNRTKYSMKPTVEGTFLMKRAQEIIALAESTASEVHESGRILSGTIAVGCAEAESMTTLSRIMADFRKEHRGVTFAIYSAIGDDIRDKIEHGILDLGMMARPVDTSHFETLELPHSNRWGLLVPSTSPLASKETITREEVVSLPLIVPYRNEVCRTLELWLGRPIDECEVAARFTLGRNVEVMVREGLGYAINIDYCTSQEGLSFIPLTPTVEVGSVFCWKKNQLFSPVVSAFIEFLKNRVEL